MGKDDADLSLGGELKQWRATNRLTKLPESKLTRRRAGTKASGQPSGKMGKIEVDLPLGEQTETKASEQSAYKMAKLGPELPPRAELKQKQATNRGTKMDNIEADLSLGGKLK